jgi:hypothetical protein
VKTEPLVGSRALEEEEMGGKRVSHFRRIALRMENVECKAVAVQRPREGYARGVSGQQLSKHVPAARDTNAIEKLCLPCGP